MAVRLKLFSLVVIFILTASLSSFPQDKNIVEAKVNPVRELRSFTLLENSFLTGRAVCADGGIEPPSAFLFSPPTLLACPVRNKFLTG